MKKLDGEKVLSFFKSTYADEHKSLGNQGILNMLESSRQKWSLGSVLNQKGVLCFSHVHVANCGEHVAAVVNACLDSGSDRILVLSVLHPYTSEMQEARTRVMKGGNPENEVLRGLFGPGRSGGDGVKTWKEDHALFSFRHFWKTAIQQRKIKESKILKTPKIIERFVHLTGDRPESLPGMDELQELAKDSIIVSTGDHCHHGLAYGDRLGPVNAIATR